MDECEGLCGKYVEELRWGLRGLVPTMVILVALVTCSGYSPLGLCCVCVARNVKVLCVDRQKLKTH